MGKKLKIAFAILVFWVFLFLGWEWWYSYPKIRFHPVVATNSEDHKVDSILHQAISDYLLPGISVAVVKDGKVKYLKAFGFKNLELKDTLNTDSKILVASVSKLFTALTTASILLKQDIQPDDRVKELKVLHDQSSSSFYDLKISEILLHRSGIKDESIAERLLAFSRKSNLDQWGESFIKSYSAGKSNEYQYADANYDLLGYLLQDSEKLSFNTIAHDAVFQKAGMNSSEFIREWPQTENSLTGYQSTVIWKRIAPKRIKFEFLPSPSSGMITTTKDVSVALIHLLRGDMGVFQPALDWLEDNQGDIVGFQKVDINGQEWLGHFGGQAGYSSFLFYNRKSEIGIFLFANSKDVDDFRLKIATQLAAHFMSE